MALFFAAMFLSAAAPGDSFGQVPAASQPPSAPPASPAILPAEVATKSSEVANLLASFSEKFAPSLAIAKIRQSLPDVSRQIDLDFTDTSAMLGEQLSLTALQAQQVEWQRRRLQLSAWLALFTQRAEDLRGTLDRLAQMKETWTKTRAAAQAEQAPYTILQQIEKTLASIEAAQLSLKAQDDAALELQGNVAREVARCDEVLAQIVEAQKSAVKGILSRDTLPIWSQGIWGRARTALPDHIRAIARGFWANVLEYVLDPSRGMPLHAGLLLVLTAVFGAARGKKRQWTASGVGVSAAVKVFERPYAAALMAALLIATSVNSPAPARIKGFFLVLELAPMIRLVRPAIDPRLIPGVFAAVILYAVDFVRQSLGGAPLVGQVILMLESLAAIAVLAWLMRAERFHLLERYVPGGHRARVLPLFAKVLMVCLMVGFLAAAFGYTRLAHLITPAALSNAVLALGLYAFFRVASGTAAIALRTWPLQRLQMVINHCDRIEISIHRVLAWVLTLMWAVRSLDYVGLLNPLQAAGSAILETKLERGAISVSIEDILAFGLTVGASYLLSAFIRFVLREEVYPRARTPSGTAYASSRLLHYAILSLGFVVGLGLLGMDLSKMSVLAGAFGVGIGFGLQSVVNNFVCGLILLFERPIHMGDTIEVGDLLGEVRRIGFRASTVRTRQGADIIIPNAQFITANVTNWTYSDRLRRIDVPVGVNYASAPNQVIDLLEKVAGAHPEVLKTPAPRCLFIGYGDSSINFELRAWTDQSADFPKIRSDLNSAIYEAVNAAGMSFPFPQREVRLLGSAAAGAPAPPQPKGGAEPPQKDK